MKTRSVSRIVAATVAAFLVTSHASGTNQVWRYSLLEGSQLVDDCPICGRPSILVPLRGNFDLRLVETNPLFSRYAIENLSFESPDGQYTVTGGGTYRIGGEVALTHELSIETTVDDGSKITDAVFTNQTQAVTRLWPMLHSICDQTNGTLLQIYQLTIAAAPIRDIWFSTVNGFTAGKPFNSTNPVSGGDLLSWSGNVVKRNSELTSGPGMPEPDAGLDAVDVLPGGEIVFSTESSGVFSDGALRFLKSRSAVLVEDLMRPIVGGPLAFDPGVDAVHVDTSAFAPLFYFSIKTNVVVFQDPEPPINLRRGDILVSDLFFEGRTHKRYTELLGRFHPVQWDGTDFGLDAMYLWPSGEIWFSTELGFQDEFLGTIMPGDLLSDQGYIVLKNLGLLSGFAPVEDLADFGLDALFVVSDAIPPALPSRMGATINVQSGNVFLEWSGAARVFQLERAQEVTGPWEAITLMTSDSSFIDVGALAKFPRAFYRLRQW